MTNAQESFFENEAASQKKKEKFTNLRTERPKFCIYCGAPLEDDDEFCTECGAKIESELAVEEESAISKESSPAPKISSDRLASIMETARLKSGGLSDEFSKNKIDAEKADQRAIAKSSSKAKSILKTGYYIHKSSEATRYLLIESVTGSSVQLTVRSMFSDGGFKNEKAVGRFAGNEFSFVVRNSDVHPLPEEFRDTPTSTTRITHIIHETKSFYGIFDEDTISGTITFITGQTQFIVFTKC